MKTIVLFSVLLLAVSFAHAEEPQAGVWDIFCNVDYPYQGADPISLFNLPAGNGAPFSEALLPDGSFVDATLRVQVLDYMSDPIVDFPFEDMWLESLDGGFIPCIGGSVSDSNTDANGWTVWAEPMKAGGFSVAPCRMLINGMVPIGWTDLDLHFNSADISGDGVVNLADVGMFSHYYFADYDYSADFHFNGRLDLVDVGYLARGVGGSCP